MKRIKQLLKKPTKEQIKDLLLIIAVISLFKIAFWGIDTHISTQRTKRVRVEADIDNLYPLNIEGKIEVKKPVEVLLTR